MLLAPNLVVAERYRLERQIGRGGMGSVWLATHLGLDIPCAVKFIEGTYATAPEAQARFVREAKAAAQLRSPHVVQILDHGVWQGLAFMAMELLEGEDLGKRLGRCGRISPQEVCFIVAQVSRALTKAHAAGIVHRDLKPDNIFLVRDDDREIAKVLDFGIAKAQGGIDGGNTKTGAMLGTPYYMSPEQAQGIRAVDYRSDLWSLAVIVFLALTGRLPFESEALGDLLVKIIVQPIPMPSQAAPDLPPTFDAWWAKAASRDPAQRYQSAKELSDALALVFGQSQLTDVMDRGEIRAAIGGRNDAQFPMGTTPNPGMLPVATMPVTPRPYTTPQPGMPQSQPFFGVLPPAQGTTGAPSAHTFGGATAVPRSRAGLYLGLASGGVLLCALGLAAMLTVKAKHAGPAAQPSAAMVSPSSSAPFEGASIAAPAPVAPASSSAGSSDGAATATAVLAPPKDTPPTPVAPSTKPRPPAAVPPPTAAKPRPTKKPDVDLGI